MPVLQEVDQQKLFSGLIPSHTHRTLPVHMRTLSKNAQAANKLEKALIHSGKKPFVCGTCVKGFTSSWNERKHCKTHK